MRSSRWASAIRIAQRWLSVISQRRGVCRQMSHRSSLSFKRTVGVTLKLWNGIWETWRTCFRSCNGSGHSPMSSGDFFHYRPKSPHRVDPTGSGIVRDLFGIVAHYRPASWETFHCTAMIGVQRIDCGVGGGVQQYPPQNTRSIAKIPPLYVNNYTCEQAKWGKTISIIPVKIMIYRSRDISGPPGGPVRTSSNDVQVIYQRFSAAEKEKVTGA